jgi:hypothetical protein
MARKLEDVVPPVEPGGWDAMALIFAWLMGKLNDVDLPDYVQSFLNDPARVHEAIDRVWPKQQFSDLVPRDENGELDNELFTMAYAAGLLDDLELPPDARDMLSGPEKRDIWRTLGQFQIKLAMVESWGRRKRAGGLNDERQAKATSEYERYRSTRDALIKNPEGLSVSRQAQLVAEKLGLPREKERTIRRALSQK